MRLYSLLIVLFFHIPSASAKIDADTLKLVDLVDRALLLQNTNPDSALLLSNYVLKESKRIQYKPGISYALLRIGNVLLNQGEADSAIKLFTRSLAIRKELNRPDEACGAALLLGVGFDQIGLKDSALNYYLESKRLADESQIASLKVSVNLELAHFNLDYKGPPYAKPFYKQALKDAKGEGSPYLKAIANSGFGKFYFDQYNYDSALYFFSNAVELFKSQGLTVEIGKVENNIALCYVNNKEYKEAKPHFARAIQIYDEMEMQEDRALCWYNIGAMYRALGDNDSALFYLNSAYHGAIQVQDIQRQMEIHSLKARIFSSNRQYDSAYFHQSLANELSDSVLSLEKVASLSEMQTKYETEKKEQEIKLLNEENKAKTAQKRLLIAGTVVLGLILFILTYFYVQRQKLAKKNAEIASSRIQNLMDEQEIKTYNAMLEGQEEERLRISADLHDRLGGMLSTIKLMYSSLGSKLGYNNDQHETQYQKATNLLDEACSEVRRISHNLGAGMIANFGLVQSIKELCDRINSSSTLQCELFDFNMEEKLPLRIEVELYRIAQEVFNNTLKHADASKVTVQLNRLETEVNMLIEDDGKGFETSSKAEGIGLQNIRKRVDSLSGRLVIDSTPGRGTTTIIEIPLD